MRKKKISKLKEHNQETIAIYLPVWNSQETIKNALLSLLNQTYKKIIIFILDNRSSDKTVSIIKNIQQKDNRIKLIIDKKKRNAVDAQTYLFKKYIIKYKFCMQIADDDIFHPKFIEITLNKIKKEKTSLSYTSYKLIDLENNLSNIEDYPTYQTYNKIKKKIITQQLFKYFGFNSFFTNLVKYITYRNIVPIVFGIFLTRDFSLSMLKYNKIYDQSQINYDNLYMIDFLANNKVSYTSKKLFYYRIKDRIKTAIERGQKGIYQLNNFSLKTFKIFIYQLTFSIKIAHIINNSNKINLISKILLNIIIFMLYFQKCLSFVLKKSLKIQNKY
jgi:glycosyltransferase involved in cell wall biosynthesis